MKYWIVTSRRKPRLWKPFSKADVYDSIYATKENAEMTLSEKEKKYYGAFPVKITLLTNNYRVAKYGGQKIMDEIKAKDKRSAELERGIKDVISSKDIPQEYAKLINKHFWELTAEADRGR